MINNTIKLTETVKDDLYTFFLFQLDKEANYLAAFTAKDSNNETAYIEKFTRVFYRKTKQ